MYISLTLDWWIVLFTNGDVAHLLEDAQTLHVTLPLTWCHLYIGKKTLCTHTPRHTPRLNKQRRRKRWWKETSLGQTKQLHVNKLVHTGNIQRTFDMNTLKTQTVTDVGLNIPLVVCLPACVYSLVTLEKGSYTMCQVERILPGSKYILPSN